MNTQKLQARELFFGTGKTQKEIAQSVGVSDRTIRSWIKEESWAAMKRAAFTMPTVIVNNISAQLVAVQDSVYNSETGVPTPEQAMTMQRLVNSLVKLRGYISSGCHYQMMSSLLMYVKSIDFDFAKKLTIYGDKYLKHHMDYTYPFEMEFGIAEEDCVLPVEPKNAEEPPAESGTKTEVKSPEKPANATSTSDEKTTSAPSKTTAQTNPTTSKNDMPLTDKNEKPILLSSGVRWHSPGYVIDPQTGLKRRIKQGEIDEFLRRGMKGRDMYDE